MSERMSERIPKQIQSLTLVGQCYVILRCNIVRQVVVQNETQESVEKS